MYATGDITSQKVCLIREPLECGADPALAARWLRGQRRPVALSGEWAGGGTLLASDPIAVSSPDDDAFALLDTQPPVDEIDAQSGAVGGGWFGWLGFNLSRQIERLPAQPPRPQQLPAFELAFYDHLVRCDASGQWWFEALATEAREAAIDSRLQLWRERLSQPVPPEHSVDAGPLRLTGTAAGHSTAVAEAIEKIAAGEVFQANVSLRLESAIEGDLLDLWVRALAAARPPYSAYVGGDDHAIASLSPELFLRRTDREVVTAPIKGTAPLSSSESELLASDKDRAEHVMIVDLMRNDLGRVCSYGTISTPELLSVRRDIGVQHLVSTVRGELHEGFSDSDLLRATFPAGSITGAPKVQAMRAISELESTAREAYCGAIGVCSPLSGLELNVAIRTFESSGGRLWLGAGGGVVSDSTPEAETREALDKARGVATAAEIGLDAEEAQPVRMAGELSVVGRPDPDQGVFETLRVCDGRCAELDAHLARLRRSCDVLGIAVPDELPEVAATAAAELAAGRLRLTVTSDGLTVESGPISPVRAEHLRPIVLPGGLGAHKWADRRTIDAHCLDRSLPLICDINGDVLEAGHAAILLLEGDSLVVPPLDGRLLPSIGRQRTLERAVADGMTIRQEAFSLERVRLADAVLLTNALRGVFPATIDDGSQLAAGAAICARLGRCGDRGQKVLARR